LWYNTGKEPISMMRSSLSSHALRVKSYNDVHFVSVKLMLFFKRHSFNMMQLGQLFFVYTTDIFEYIL
jgi:hypothetical protein